MVRETMDPLSRDITSKIGVWSSVPIFRQDRKQLALSLSRTDHFLINKLLKKRPEISDEE